MRSPLFAISGLVAAMLVAGAFGVVVLLFVVGWRQRLTLEIPPRDYTPVPMSPRVSKVLVTALVVGYAAWLAGVIAFLAGVPWLGYAGLGVYLAGLVARLAIQTAHGIAIRRARARESR